VNETNVVLDDVQGPWIRESHVVQFTLPGPLSIVVRPIA